MLYNKDFLLKLDKSKNKTIYARITALTFDESPVEYIEGRVTGGSINIDGASALRRTCSLSMVAQDFNYSDYYWGLNSKFKLEIGVENLIDPAMPDIIWFKQGTYLITGFNTSRNTNNFTISINGKDKMCLLNGEVGGSLESSVDFGTIEEETEDGVWLIRKIPIPDIIKNLVHTYAKEPYWNIIINDLDTYGLELLEYRYDTPMYLYRLKGSSIFTNVLIENKDTKVYLSTQIDEDIFEYPADESSYVLLENVPISHLDLMVEGMTGSVDPLPVKIDNHEVYLAKVEYGQTAGYRTTDLTYAGDLIANVGESLTSVLDKIRNMLVEFEYFYDLDGRFVFQKKKSFTSTLWSPISTDEQGNAAVTESLMLASATAYTFSGGELITAFNNNPNLLNMRNDYSIWGEREGASGAKIPVHMRYAIDLRPNQYTSIEVDYGYTDNEGIFHPGKDFEIIDSYNQKHGTRLKGQSAVTYKTDDGYEWRELIYLMAKDYYKYNHLDDFELRVIAHNPHYPTGRTGYESYYIDIQGFWRQLYNPELREKIATLKDRIGIEQDDVTGLFYGGTLNEELLKAEEDEKKFDQQVTDKAAEINEKANPTIEATAEENPKDGPIEIDQELSQLYTELVELQNKLATTRDTIITLEEERRTKSVQLENYLEDIQDYYYDEYDADGNIISTYDGYDNTKPIGDSKKKYWNRNVLEHPELLNFWFDFLDTEGELQQYNVRSVGSRSKSVNDTAIKSIYFRETPTVIFYSPNEEIRELSGYKYIQVPDMNMDSMFSISAQGKSAKDKLDELIYQHGYCTESATINAIPIYYLEPNVRVYVYDKDTGLDGEYVVSKITLPLTYNGTMSLTATKAAKSLI